MRGNAGGDVEGGGGQMDGMGTGSEDANAQKGDDMNRGRLSRV